MSVLLVQHVNDGPEALGDMVAARALRAEVLVAMQGDPQPACFEGGRSRPVRRP